MLYAAHWGISCVLSCEFSALWLFLLIILAIIIQDELKVQNHARQKASVNRYRKNLSLAVKLDVNPTQDLQSFRLTGTNSTVCFEK